MSFDKKLLDQIRQYFRDKPVQKAYILGSRARGDAREDSDIDLLVKLDHSVSVGLLFIRMQPDLQKIPRRKVDLLTERGISQYLKPHIECDKVLMYEK